MDRTFCIVLIPAANTWIIRYEFCSQINLTAGIITYNPRRIPPTRVKDDDIIGELEYFSNKKRWPNDLFANVKIRDNLRPLDKVHNLVNAFSDDEPKNYETWWTISQNCLVLLLWLQAYHPIDLDSLSKGLHSDCKSTSGVCVCIRTDGKSLIAHSFLWKKSSTGGITPRSMARKVVSSNLLRIIVKACSQWMNLFLAVSCQFVLVQNDWGEKSHMEQMER